MGLVARNGTGKSTLMSVLMDKEGHESGDIIYRRDLKVGYLEQSPQFDPEESVLQACFNHEDDPGEGAEGETDSHSCTLPTWNSRWDSSAADSRSEWRWRMC